ncbi:hypothetical protein DTW91_09975 [Chryseobacterium sp. SC28]|nr:hypothetical protein DTW91_09975 [Chryseobacterium sp. SC28]
MSLLQSLLLFNFLEPLTEQYYDRFARHFSQKINENCCFNVKIRKIQNEGLIYSFLYICNGLVLRGLLQKASYGRLLIKKRLQ